VRLFTIGFTQKPAKTFFSLLRDAGVSRLLDTRLNNRSQLAGFSKAGDLEYFLMTIGGIGYRHAPELAPTQEMLDGYKKLRGAWDTYEIDYRALLTRRNVSASILSSELENACLLCSEHLPTYCHRRLAAEYLKQSFPELQIIHLV